MWVAHLSLADYRNYRIAEVDFQPGHNLVLGRNGQGKTNLVEAIAYFATLRSHRVSNDAALIRAGADTAVARLRIGVKDREALLEIQLNRGAQNRARLNRNTVRPRELTRWFSTVVFAPEDLMIVRGEPSVRRRFLDEAVIARNPAMTAVLGDYERVVRQRTALLKSARGSGARSMLDATLSVWDEQLIELGSRLMLERRRLVAGLRRPLADAYAALVGQDHLPRLSIIESVSRETDLPDDPAAPTGVAEAFVTVSRETIAEQFRTALAAIRGQEMDRGVTLIGPHRDDLAFELNRLPVKGYASHGESWSFALSLKLAVAGLLRQESAAGDPVIILDDVFAELDAGRRERLMAAAGDYEQVIVTAAVEEDVPVPGGWHILRISEGTVLGADADSASAVDPGLSADLARGARLELSESRAAASREGVSEGGGRTGQS